MSNNFEQIFKNFKSYYEILKQAKELGKPDVSTAAWILTRVPTNIAEIYNLTEDKFISYFESGNYDFIDEDFLSFYTKSGKRAFGLKWEEDHFKVETFGTYF